MKRIVFLLLSVLMLNACSKPVKTTETPLPVDQLGNDDLIVEIIEEDFEQEEVKLGDEMTIEIEPLSTPDPTKSPEIAITSKPTKEPEKVPINTPQPTKQTNEDGLLDVYSQYIAKAHEYSLKLKNKSMISHIDKAKIVTSMICYDIKSYSKYSTSLSWFLDYYWKAIENLFDVYIVESNNKSRVLKEVEDDVYLMIKVFDSILSNLYGEIEMNVIRNSVEISSKC